MTNEQLTTRVNQLERQIAILQSTVNSLTTNTNSRIQLADLSRTEKTLKALITDNSNDVVRIDRKLAKISLPEETRLYLEESEVDEFSANFAKLKAMMAEFETLYRNLVAYNASRASS